MVVCSLAFTGGCAATSGDVLTADDGKAAVFGKFELVKNGQQVRIGEGLFAHHATLLFNEQGADDEIIGKVGRDGEFTWYLAPGDYHVSAVAFSNHGERVEPGVSLNFTVQPDMKAAYIGTIRVESSFDSGYYGTDARLGATTVRDDCWQDCAARLAELNLTEADLYVSILHRPGQVARTD
jgi:hypothetical protein